jgi:hypothetical protein
VTSALLRFGDRALPSPPTRDALIHVALTFQGLIVPSHQFGRMPWFEACLPWLTPQDRCIAYDMKHESGAHPHGDTHCIVALPDGVPLYDEPNQFYTTDKFGPLDWTQGNTTIDPKFPSLIREVIRAGFPQVQLYLGGDGGGDNYLIAFKQLHLLAACADYRTTLYKYCNVLPGWDGVFYGWPLWAVMAFGLLFRQLFPTGTLALHYSAGHIPVGEGGGDYQPRGAHQNPMVNPGRMTDYDLLVGEYEDNLHLDDCWQILNRLEKIYIRPPDQPPLDDPNRAYYLGTPNPRGEWGHDAMEFGLYEFVRSGGNMDAFVQHVNANRAYLKSMGTECTG